MQTHKFKKMKKLIFYLLLAFGLSGAMEAKSQVVVVKDGTMTFSDGVNTFNSIRSTSVTLPGGYMLKTATFQLTPDHDLIPEKGTKIIGVRIILESETDENGNVIITKYISDEKVDINHKGKFKVVMHLNGAGYHLPFGWYDPGYYEN